MLTVIYTRAWLEKVGFKHNPNMWIGSGWSYCVVCAEYTYHFAMSSDKVECVEVCKECQAYSGNKSILIETSLIEN